MKPLNAEIIRLYTEELKSTNQIADQLAEKGINLSPEIVRYRLRSYGVQLRPRPERKRGENRIMVQNRERPPRAKPVEQHVAPLRVMPQIDYEFPPHLQRQFDAHMRQVRLERAWS
jgi:hypothetical protein